MVGWIMIKLLVVLYLHSTSNHNQKVSDMSEDGLYYIFILHQTTTEQLQILQQQLLYYIFILHQTTTLSLRWSPTNSLYYIFILHQTTTLRVYQIPTTSCIISSFYIKPQPSCSKSRLKSVVLYLHSTSNHNTFLRTHPRLNCCIISSFYIKPQLLQYHEVIAAVVLYLHSTSNHNWSGSPVSSLYVVLYLHSTSNHNCGFRSNAAKSVVLYLHSTSNHNLWRDEIFCFTLYYIFILHQTTTYPTRAGIGQRLYYIFILHQTTTGCSTKINTRCCIISSFYIKPQPLKSSM